MTPPDLLSSTELVVAQDYGQFYLHTALEDDLELNLKLLEEADDGIAQWGGFVLVLSPHQNNFEMRLTIEIWSSPADDDLNAWEEAFEVHLDVGEFGLAYESPTLSVVQLPVPPGSYHALLTGRGFVANGWPGSTKPGDSWRLRLWPSPGPARPARLKAY